LLFAVMGDGYAALSVATGGTGIWWVLLMIAGGKAVASALTVGSGGAGGYFAPSMVIGGCVGAGIGMLFYQALPAGFLPAGMFPTDEAGMMTVTAVFALVGMAGFWTSVSKGPIGSVIIVSELTGSYHLLLPAMWTCAITFILSRHIKLFTAQVPTRLDSPAHMGDFAADVLKEIRVQEVLDDLAEYETVDEGTPIQQILSMKSSRQHYYPVVDREGKFVGVFSLNDLRAVLEDAGVWQLLVARDVARTDMLTVHPGETLAEVAAKFSETSLEELPVVEKEDKTKLLGIISRRQLNNAYIKRVMKYEQAAKAENARPGQSTRLRKSKGRP
jgi:chloride channel protein, CIC family